MYLMAKKWPLSVGFLNMFQCKDRMHMVQYNFHKQLMIT